MPSETMTRPNPRLIVLLLIIALLGTSFSARADCKDVIQKCDAAIAAKERQVSLCDLALRQSIERGTMLTLEVQEKDAQLSAWFRNPFTTVTVGALLGLVVAGIALK